MLECSPLQNAGVLPSPWFFQVLATLPSSLPVLPGTLKAIFRNLGLSATLEPSQDSQCHCSMSLLGTSGTLTSSWVLTGAFDFLKYSWVPLGTTGLTWKA